MSKGYAYMKNKPKIAVLGGDLRQYAVVKELLKKNVSVYASGLCVEHSEDSDIKVCEDFTEAVNFAEAVVLPLPASTDGNLLNCPTIRDSERIPLADIIDAMRGDSVLLGGRIPQNTVVKAQAKGIKVFDYFLSEKLQIKNAYITSEAALSIAMNSLDKCIKGAKFAITGSGRIARFLAELLIRLGGEVTVAARNADSLAYFEIMGCKPLRISGNWYDKLLHDYDIIFNTVPSWLFDRSFLERVDPKTLILELASAPGGIDICAARELSSNVRWGASLPGKYAPYSAGMLIAEYIFETLESEEVGAI
jgi:dipicolinate synthase subunit A